MFVVSDSYGALMEIDEYDDGLEEGSVEMETDGVSLSAGRVGVGRCVPLFPGEQREAEAPSRILMTAAPSRSGIL